MSTITGLKTARTRRLIAGVAAAAALLGASTACGGSAGAENADGTTTVRYQSALGSVDTLQLAAALGKLPGIKLDKVGDVTGGPASLQALVSNQIDISSSAFYGAVAQVVATGAPIQAVVSTYGTNAKTGAAVVAKKGSSLTEDPRSFIGKKVAVNTLGANAEAVLDTWFEKGGLSTAEIKKVTLVALPPLNTVQALKEGQIDAAYIGIGQLKAAQEALPLDVIFKDSDVIGFYNGGGVSLRTDWIKNEKEASKTLVSGISYAVDYIESHDRQQVLDVYVPWLKEQGFTDAVEAVEKNWAGSTGVSSKGGLIADKDISIWLDWLAGRGDVDPSKIKASDVYTNQFNPQS
ncbi:ABC transporter substrate-binding protein [Nocardioides cavernaquae]|uniref:ABC transporter substrate-binding protein n=1 Tax=Nocardioides cavernaquae TaxID=2321396 RepID=A0A3A5HF72_9ACTN|nr:ABC transporter substrate-binding protein [Nocardioides cavernaquae]RJS46684.1 ABC transporter substrate-binding protein [Nocardioides cavernaquae]